ncbi:MAG: tetratricopeptide repeat protein [Calothrix sp. MO_167.B42]|nr:tetratricopeptide repeat protein [Calothrix sp. MO_167.B42]
MRKSRRWHQLIVIFLTVGAITITTPVFSFPNPFNLGGLNLIMGIQGKVWFKRDGGSKFQPASMGTFLKSSDRLRLGSGSSAKVICQNLKLKEIKKKGVFPVSQTCLAQSNSKPNLVRPNIDLVSPRGPKDFNIPYVLSPRNSNILDEKPTLRWHPVEGVSSYTVEVSGGKDATWRWTKQVKQPSVVSVVYDGQPLERGWNYWVTIKANGLSTRVKDTPRFSLLKKKHIQKIKGEVAQLQQSSLPPEPKTIALAHLYRTNNLNSQAIELLEGLVKQGSKTTAVYQDLGFLYWKVGLHQLGKQRYLTALKLVETEKNQEGKAQIQEGLGKVSKRLGDSQEALKWFEGARNSYVELGGGYQQKVEKLEEELKELQGRLG